MSAKREAEDGDDDRPVKRPKPSYPTSNSRNPSGTLNNAQLKIAVEQGTLKKMTVAELKDVLASKGLSIAGKKGDLIDRLEQWVDGSA